MSVHTKEEAALLWCPFVRVTYNVGDPNEVTVNRTDDPHQFDERCCCIGPECMAWRVRGLRPDGTKLGNCGLVPEYEA